MSVGASTLAPRAAALPSAAGMSVRTTSHPPTTGASSVLTFECQVEHDVVDQSADAVPVEFDDP